MMRDALSVRGRRAVLAGGLMVAAIVGHAAETPKAEAPAFGVIAGTLNYPSEGIPPLRVCAISMVNSSVYRCVRTKTDQKVYRIGRVRPGSYHVMAYVREGAWGVPQHAAGYTRAVTCGLKAGCDDHALIPVEVRPGKLVRGIDPQDWGPGRDSLPEEPR